MNVFKLTQKDILKYSKVCKDIIKNLNFYNQKTIIESLHYFNQANIKLKLKDKDNIFLLHKKDGFISGFLRGTINNRSGIMHITWIGVVDEARKQGVASEMLECFIEIGRNNKNIHKIICNIVPGNNKSLNFFKKYGFKKQTLLKRHTYQQDFYMFYKFIK